ncbi:hypothetical protein F3Y22_tig00112000pilonHSYRG00113 [Hibiscus syriacus]|uniref:Transposase MuDR plant domain-containing protein n=1 Tax=Hibiscus syriacus TaxID=106335 RepID=A0A6A2X707_HIBSY|nr:hypothetical protein F3Y22_tig00112000pilonHSYRG00113 [Hibiscus syriacus]
MHFDLRIVKSDQSRFIAKCSKEGCMWRVHVAKCPGVPTFTIRTPQGNMHVKGFTTSIISKHRNGVWLHFMGLLKKGIAFFLHTVSKQGRPTQPLLELDKANLKGKYLGTLLCSAAVDADDALFPLAIAIVDVEIK